MQIIRTIDHTLYPRKALADARQTYGEYCTLHIVPVDSTTAQITITVKEAHRSDGNQVVLEFLNYALDRAAQMHLEAGETD